MDKVTHHWLNALRVAQFPYSFGHKNTWLSMSVMFKALNVTNFLRFGLEVLESVLNSILVKITPQNITVLSEFYWIF